MMMFVNVPIIVVIEIMFVFSFSCPLITYRTSLSLNHWLYTHEPDRKKRTHPGPEVVTGSSVN